MTDTEISDIDVPNLDTRQDAREFVAQLFRETDLNAIQIAELIGRPAQTVRQLKTEARKAGLDVGSAPVAPRPPQRIPSEKRDEVRAQVLALRDEGLAYQEIADRLELTVPIVYALLHEAGQTAASKQRVADRDELLIELYRADAPLAVIAERTGFSDTAAVSLRVKTLRESGVDLPQRRASSRASSAEVEERRAALREAFAARAKTGEGSLSTIGREVGLPRDRVVREHQLWMAEQGEVEIDDTDRKILELHGQDPKPTNAQIAEQVGLTVRAVTGRLRILRAQGLVKYRRPPVAAG